MSNEENPINIILITSGSRGQRLLFRYPYQTPNEQITQHSPPAKRKETLTQETVGETLLNPYKLNQDHYISEPKLEQEFLQNGHLFGYSDSLLANILAPKLTLCDQNFELSVDHVKFVGFPVLVNHDDDSGFEECLLADDNSLLEDVMIKMVHIVLVVKCYTDARIITHYQNICKMIGKALRHEEKRYLPAKQPVIKSQENNM